MTVKVRQLTRTTGGGIVPPPPPPPPTMSFLQQPTDTQVGDPFNPPITVSISTGASDSLTIYSYSGCAFSPTTITAVNGTGTFTGLIAQTVGMGCRFGVHNNSNADITDIISMPFNILAPPIQPLEIVNGGNAYNTVMSNDGFSVEMNTQWNGNPMDTTGADLILVILATDAPVLGTNLIANVDGVNTPINWTQLNLTTDIGPTFTYFFVQPTPIQTGVSLFRFLQGLSIPSMTVLALRGWNGITPTIFEVSPFTILSTTTADTMRLPAPLPTLVSNDFIIAVAATWRGSTALFPPGYSGNISRTFTGGGYASAAAWKFMTNANEDPVFESTLPQPGFTLQWMVSAMVFGAA